MARLDCQEPGCGGNGMIACLYTNEEKKTFRWTSRCCRVCNRHDKDVFKAIEKEELVKYVVSESNLRAEGYRDVLVVLKVQTSPPKKVATG